MDAKEKLKQRLNDMGMSINSELSDSEAILLYCMKLVDNQHLIFDKTNEIYFNQKKAIEKKEKWVSSIQVVAIALLLSGLIGLAFIGLTAIMGGSL